MRKKCAFHSGLVVAAMLMMAVPSQAGNWYCSSTDCPTDIDWQWFAPIHQDVCVVENPPANEGYFFDVERMYVQMARPDRAPIGVNAVTQAWIPNSVNVDFTQFPTNTLGTGMMATNAATAANLSAIFPLVSGGVIGTQYNAIDDAYTQTGDGWGNRWEFGRVTGNCGWMVSIIEGIDIVENSDYGFDDKRRNQLGAAQGLDGIDGIPDQDGTGAGTATNPVAPVGGIQSILAIDGLLTVPVFFNDPDGLLLGFADNFGGTVITSAGAPDQLPDDLNGDGMITAADLIRIAVVFDDLSVQHNTKLDGVEVMGLRRKKRLYSGFDLEMFLGARYLELNDRFAVIARGGTLADSDWKNQAHNRLVGPQFGFRTSHQKRRWTTTLQGRFMAAANFLSIRQNGTLGDHLAVAAPGVPYAFGGQTFFHRMHDERFTPVGELQVDCTCQLTRSISAKVGYTGLILGNISRASNTVVYDLPSLGIRNHSEEVYSGSITFGVELNR